MQIIAIGLEEGNPVAYMILFMFLYPPIMVIAHSIFDKWKDFKERKS